MCSWSLNESHESFKATVLSIIMNDSVVRKMSMNDSETEKECNKAGIPYLEVGEHGVTCYVCEKKSTYKNWTEEKEPHVHNALEILCAAGR